MFVIPLGAAVTAIAVSLALFVVLIAKAPPTRKWEIAEISTAVVLLAAALIVFLGAFHQGPLYKSPPPVNHGRKL